MTERTPITDHKIAVLSGDGITYEEQDTFVEVSPERQLTFKLLDGAVKLTAAAGILFGAATVLF